MLNARYFAYIYFMGFFPFGKKSVLDFAKSAQGSVG